MPKLCTPAATARLPAYRAEHANRATPTRAHVLAADLTRDLAGRRHDQAAPAQTSSASTRPRTPGSWSAMMIPTTTVAAMTLHLGTFRSQGGAVAPAPTATGSDTHNCQPAGGGPHAGSGAHPGGGVHPGGGAGQLGGGLKRTSVPDTDVIFMIDSLLKLLVALLRILGVGARHWQRAAVAARPEVQRLCVARGRQASPRAVRGLSGFSQAHR